MKIFMLIAISFILFYVLALWIHDINFHFGLNYVTMLSIIYVIWCCFKLNQHKLWKGCKQMPKKTKYEKNFFLKEIEEILGNSFIYAIRNKKYYKECPKTNSIYIEYNTNGITFEQLEKLSVLCGTKKINFTGSTEEFSYSEYTSDTTLGGKIEIFDVVFPEKTEI